MSNTNSNVTETKIEENKDSGSKDLRRYYREAIFIMYGIVMTQSFYGISYMVIEKTQTIFGNETEYLQWIFVNVLILSSWIGYMNVIIRSPYKTNSYSVLLLILDIVIILEYHFLINASIATEFFIPFNTFLHYMLITIFSTYIMWDFCWRGRMETHNTPLKLFIKLLPTGIALLLICIHYWAHYTMNPFYVQYLNYVSHMLSYMLSHFNINLESDLVGNIIISMFIILIYRIIKYRQNRLKN